MRKHLKFHLVWGYIVAAILMAQLGCSSKSSENAATAQPSPSPNTATALVAASPAADATSNAAGNPGAAPANAAGGSGAAAGNPGTAPSNPAGAASAPAGALAGNPAGASVAAPPPAPRVFTIAAGTPITIYTANTLSTKTDNEGRRFTASLARPIVDGDWVIAKRGASVEGVVINSDPGGRVKGRASMTIRLRSLQLADGRTVDISSSSYTKVAKSSKKKDALKIGIGAGIGAAIGAIAVGGKGAAIGAGTGGAAGTGYVQATRGDPAVIPSESQLTFRLQAPITVTKR